MGCKGKGNGGRENNKSEGPENDRKPSEQGALLDTWEMPGYLVAPSAFPSAWSPPVGRSEVSLGTGARHTCLALNGNGTAIAF